MKIKTQTAKKLLIFLMAGMMIFSQASLVYAQDVYDYQTESQAEEDITKFLCTPKQPDGSGETLFECINKVYKFVIAFASAVAVLFIVIAGWVYMSAEGNQESVDKAKNILVTTITALVILLGSYVLLKAINPDLVQLRPIQPLDTTPGALEAPPEGAPTLPTQSGQTAAAVTSAGCAFQTSKQSEEIISLNPSMYQTLLQICSTTKSAGFTPQISSVIGYGQHATDSQHYKGCAIDFAGGDPNYVNSDIGKAVIAAARSAGIARINPGTDANQTVHVHVDLNCN